MTTTLDFLKPVDAQKTPVAETLIAIADTKLVLGNWHITCVQNGKSLPDFAALLAMSASAFGHARALYDHLATFGLEFAYLERGRGADAIHALAALDAAPRDWQDFVAAIYLADQATWLQAARYLAHADRTLAGLARRIGEETYFHLKYATGWAQEFARDPATAVRARDALLRRYRQALAWFPALPGDAEAAARREAFAKAAQEFLDIVEQGGELPTAADTSIHGSEAPLRRRQPLPAGLYERVRFKDPDAAP